MLRDAADSRMRRMRSHRPAPWGLLGLVLGGAVAAAEAPPGNAYQETVRVVDRPWERIGITVTVTDRQGRAVRDLACDDFRVLEGGEPIDLAECGPEEGRQERPLSVAVLLDLSQSMGSQIHEVEDAARALLAGLRPGDEILVAKFNDQVTVLQPFTGDGAPLEQSLRSIGRARGGTALFQSIESILKDVRDRPGRKVVLVVSDGQDNTLDRAQPVTQSLFMQDLLRLCLRSQIVVYGVRPGMPSSWQAFEGFVEATGGRMLYTGGDLPRLFARLGEEFRSQYYLAWDIDPDQDAKGWRRLRVAVTRPDLVVHAIDGYFTPRDRLAGLLHDIEDRDARLRQDAASDLGFVDDPRARLALRAALDDDDPGVRRLAIEGVARLKETRALDAIVERLGDEEKEVRAAASSGLEAFGPDAIEPLARAVEAAASRRWPPHAMAGAAASLGSLGDDRAIAPLSALLLAHPVESRVAAARALRDLGLADGLAPLRRALEDLSPDVRRAAAEGLLAIGGAASRPILRARLSAEPDAGVRQALLALLEAP
jgi:VWFA-related protein